MAADSPEIEVRIIGGAKGKGLFALRKFTCGEIIFEERPLVCAQFLWNEAYGYEACDYCMTPLETAEENAHRLTGKQNLCLPYPECCRTKKENLIECPECDECYCSVACRDQAWDQYHHALCLGGLTEDGKRPLQQLQNLWRHVHYPPETASIMLVARIIATIKQAKDKIGALHLFSQFCHRTVNEEEELAHKLLGSKFEAQIECLRQLMSQIFPEEELQNLFAPESFRSLISLVATNGQGIGTSAFGAWVRNCDNLDLPAHKRIELDSFIEHIYEDIKKETGAFLNNEGSGLYPLQSSCNHSCIPNAEATFPYNNFTLVMEAVCDIEKGEEIIVSYLDECNRHRSRHSRIKILRENYLFTCSCMKCTMQMNDPDCSSDSD